MNHQSVQAALQALREGKLVLVIDDEDRENEGDLICAAQSATTWNVNFMATHAKGIDLHAHERATGPQADASAHGRAQHR